MNIHDSEAPMSVDEDEEALAAIIGEIQDQLNQGMPLDLDPFMARHPRYAHQLEAFFQCGDFVEQALLPSAPPPTDAQEDDPARLDLATFPISRRLADEPLGTVYLLQPAPGSEPTELIVLRAWLKPVEREAAERHAVYLSTVRVPGILRVVDSGRLNQVPFFIREHASGPSLAFLSSMLNGLDGQDDIVDVFSRWFVEGEKPTDDVPPTERIEVAADLAKNKRHVRVIGAIFSRWAAMLEDLHTGGAIHGEITPSRLIFSRDGAPLIQGAGLSWVGTGVDLKKMRHFDPGWLAPEVIDSACTPVTWRADVYGLALSMTSVLTLLRPNDVASDPHVGAGRALVDRLPKALPKELIHLLEQSLDTDPHLRPPSLAAFRRDLDAAIPGIAELGVVNLRDAARLTKRRGSVRSWRWGLPGFQSS